MQSADNSVGEVCGSNSPFSVKNLKFLTFSNLVLFSLFLGVDKYSQKHMQKKIAPIANVASDFSEVESNLLYSSRNTLIGIDIWCVSVGSLSS
jgi:hypothetical protein